MLKRKGKGAANAGSWWAYLPGWAFVYLAESACADHLSEPFHAFPSWSLPPVRMTLAELVHLLRDAGYGDPVDVGVDN